MTEFTVGTWNALNAFGDEHLDDARFQAAFEIVRRMDADIIAIPETARHGAYMPSIEYERQDEITARMAAEGYRGLSTDYTSVPTERNAHYISLWTRLDTAFSNEVHTYGERHSPFMAFPQLELVVRGLHLHDRDIAKRLASAHDVIAMDRRTDYQSIVLMDANNMYRNDPRGRVPRLLGRVVNKLEVSDYYDPNLRFQRLAGKVIRTCRMAEGSALEAFRQAGYHDADPTMQPTIGKGRIAFQLDHILGSSGVIFEDFTVHERSAAHDGPAISDHAPITARAILA